jgi:PEGA domain
MHSRAIVLMICGAALSACTGIPSMPSFNMPSFNPNFSIPGFNAPGTPVRIESVPPGAEATFGSGPGCRTPCSLPAPSGNGTYNVSFTLKGYEPQSVPVRIQLAQNSWDSADAGTMAGVTVIEPDPVVVELTPVPVAAPPPKKRPVAPVAPKPPKQPTAAGSPPPPPPPPTPGAAAPGGFSPAPAAPPGNVFR